MFNHINAKIFQLMYFKACSCGNNLTFKKSMPYSIIFNPLK